MREIKVICAVWYLLVLRLCSTLLYVIDLRCTESLVYLLSAHGMVIWLREYTPGTIYPVGLQFTLYPVPKESYLFVISLPQGQGFGIFDISVCESTLPVLFTPYAFRIKNTKSIDNSGKSTTTMVGKPITRRRTERYLTLFEMAPPRSNASKSRYISNKLWDRISKSTNIE